MDSVLAWNSDAEEWVHVGKMSAARYPIICLGIPKHVWVSHNISGYPITTWSSIQEDSPDILQGLDIYGQFEKYGNHGYFLDINYLCYIETSASKAGAVPISSES